MDDWETRDMEVRNHAQTVFLNSLEETDDVRNCVMMLETTRACDPGWKIRNRAIQKSVEIIRKTKDKKGYDLLVEVLGFLNVPIPDEVSNLLKEIS